VWEFECAYANVFLLSYVDAESTAADSIISSLVRSIRLTSDSCSSTSPDWSCRCKVNRFDYAEEAISIRPRGNRLDIILSRVCVYLCVWLQHPSRISSVWLQT